MLKFFKKMPIWLIIGLSLTAIFFVLLNIGTIVGMLLGTRGCSDMHSDEIKQGLVYFCFSSASIQGSDSVAVVTQEYKDLKDEPGRKYGSSDGRYIASAKRNCGFLWYNIMDEKQIKING